MKFKLLNLLNRKRFWNFESLDFDCEEFRFDFSICFEKYNQNFWWNIKKLKFSIISRICQKQNAKYKFIKWNLISNFNSIWIKLKNENGKALYGLLYSFHLLFITMSFLNLERHGRDSKKYCIIFLPPQGA